MKKEFNFSEEFANINEEWVEQAGKEWKVQKNHIFLLYSRKIASVAILIMVCIAAMGNSTVKAAVKGFTTKIGEMFGFTRDLSSYTEIVNQTRTENGISLTLKEVILDDRVLMLTIHQEFEEGEISSSFWVNQEKTTINGQNHQVYESISSDGYSFDTLEPEADTVLVQVYEDQVLPEGEVRVHLVLDTGVEAPLPSETDPDCTAEFVYDFVITPKELKEQTVKENLDIKVAGAKAGRKDIMLKDLTMNDLYCRIAATGITWDDDWVNEYDLKLKGTDSFGNPVCLEGIRFLSEKEMVFATDFLGDYENTTVADEDFQMSVPDKNCEYLDLQLYERKMVWDVVEEVPDENGEYSTQIMDEDKEAYSGQGNYGWEPVGKPFRVTITHNQ